jgi:hypothetical protein
MRGTARWRWRIMSAPRISIRPALGRISPRSMPIVVVLPAPLPPSRPTMRPAPRAKETPSTAVVAPKRLTSPSTSITGESMESLMARRSGNGEDGGARAH